jgi:hypothetical protein
MCSIPGLALNVETIKQTEIALMDDEVPIWEVDNSWGYDIDKISFQLNQSGKSLILNLSTDNLLNVKVKTITETSYQLSISGKLEGEFNYKDETGTNIGGLLFFTRITSGNLQIRIADLAAEEVKIIIKTIALVFEHPLFIPVPIPIPLEITISITPDTPRPLIDFPLYNGKIGLISESNLSITITAGSIILQILNFIKPDFPSEINFDQKVALPMLLYNTTEEEVTVGETTYTAYNIGYYLGLIGSIYYAPLAGNIVKAIAEIKTNDIIFELQGELKESTYT